MPLRIDPECPSKAGIDLNQITRPFTRTKLLNTVGHHECPPPVAAFGHEAGALSLPAYSFFRTTINIENFQDFLTRNPTLSKPLREVGRYFSWHRFPSPILVFNIGRFG
jgi:hypothetical protein